jgi:hypothetical protein
MTTNSGDAGSAPVETGGTESPYEIGYATDDARGTDETGPKPLDPELEDEQVRGDA